MPVFWCPQMRARIGKVDTLSWTLSNTNGYGNNKYCLKYTYYTNIPFYGKEKSIYCSHDFNDGLPHNFSKIDEVGDQGGKSGK